MKVLIQLLTLALAPYSLPSILSPGHPLLSTLTQGLQQMNKVKTVFYEEKRGIFMPVFFGY